MPHIQRKLLTSNKSNPDLERLTLINAESGSGYLEVGEVTIAPGKKIPMHIHQTHEEGIYIMDGPLDYVLGDQSGTALAGEVILAPARIKHEITNNSTEARRIMFIFPTTNVHREFVE